MTIPNGFWQWDPGAQVYSPSHMVNSDMFVWDGACVASNPPYSTIGWENVSSFLDPSYAGDRALNTREMMMDIAAHQEWYNTQYTSGMNWFDISGTGFI